MSVSVRFSARRGGAGLLAAVLLAVAAPAGGADLVVTVRDSNGAPLPWAVVTLDAPPGAGTGSWRAPPPVMRQQGMLFDPFVLSVRAGSEVSFPNLDGFRHHVYSFSAAKRFELRLYGQDETKTVVFDRPGVVALGCNIHDNMLSYVHVTARPVHGVTDASGQVRFAGLPAGTWALHVWHPDAARGEAGAGTAILAATRPAAANAVVDLRAVRRHQQPPRAGGYR